ncbi:MAG: hypothetical protein CVV64_11775 [Candidatus Wallbacteria bacterium HGW-Wallbacteria-1]|uniref:ArnR1-like winged helix-turn-helix domain-containing protein n=1 Tax=Candidatus Wallbacteria bacterium HGW-Wallbacteria-1 TaxID=2013854 RepID=A0A2N1PNS9_9BACT|nr:MAG: hypothetical protein CVV64_11775 [Candidatus Wallbacteria bacterium HGW-Wallbacteria-1]
MSEVHDQTDPQIRILRRRKQKMLTHWEKYHLIPEYRRFTILAALLNIISRTGRSRAHLQEIKDYIKDPHVGDKDLKFFMNLFQKDLDSLVTAGLIEGSLELRPTEAGYELFRKNMRTVFGFDFRLQEIETP